MKDFCVFAVTYYNENDRRAAAWLRELIRSGLIPEGDVDERSITDVRAGDVGGYDQCHFFAGIGGWPYALELAGWGARPVWTGSCPCQPFSAAGKRAGESDPRHLWPAFRGLIAECAPATVFGEQVSSKAGRRWLNGVRTDLEALDYEVGAADLCAAGVGAPHIRQRLFWVADASGKRRQQVAGSSFGDEEADGRAGWKRIEPDSDNEFAGDGENGAGGLADAGHERAGWPAGCGEAAGGRSLGDIAGRGAWSDYDLIPCADGKTRRAESGVQQMVDGISCCLGYLRSDQKEKIIYASKTSGLGDEAMRALRQGYGAYEIWRTLGGCLGFPETALLLASMCEQSWKLGTVVLGSLSDIPKVREAVLRALRQFESSPCTSQEWKPSRQCVDKFRDALCELPPEASQIAGAAVTYPLIRNAPARMGRLRGYGNAIVPQLAAQFVTAFAEATA